MSTKVPTEDSEPIGGKSTDYDERDEGSRDMPLVIGGVLLWAFSMGIAWGYERHRKRAAFKRQKAALMHAIRVTNQEIGIALLPAFQKAVVAFKECTDSMAKLQETWNLR